MKERVTPAIARVLRAGRQAVAWPLPVDRSRRSDTNRPTLRPAFSPAWLSNCQWMPP